MFLFPKTNWVLITITAILFTSPYCYTLSEKIRSKGFVYLHEIDPTILVSLRYNTYENFVGTPIDGYKQSVVIMTRQAAEALKQVQKRVQKDGYCLVIYDAYRPQQAVNHFMRWSNDCNDQSKKSQYYARIDKSNVFDLGYVARRSGHSRGSTIDLTIIRKDAILHEIQETKRTLLDGHEITLLDDGTEDMGSSFDLFDLASHPNSNLIEEEYKIRRTYLKNIMEQHGFKVSSCEWWHFTLRDEPYPADQENSYFNFLVE